MTEYDSFQNVKATSSEEIKLHHLNAKKEIDAMISGIKETNKEISNSAKEIDAELDEIDSLFDDLNS